MVPENLGFRMHALIRGWADFVIANRLAVLISVALFLVIALFTGPTTPYDNSTERYFVDGDPTIQDYDRAGPVRRQ
jgi:predicted RND superfamily exporter protein